MVDVSPNYLILFWASLVEEDSVKMDVNYLILVLVGIIFILGVVLILILISVFRKRNNQKPINHNITAANIPRPTEKYIKRCPACQSTYTDESLNYCLSDGTLLEGANNASDEVETVLLRTKTKG